MSPDVRRPVAFVRDGVFFALGDFDGVRNGFGLVFEKLGLFCLVGCVGFECCAGFVFRAEPGLTDRIGVAVDDV